MSSLDRVREAGGARSTAGLDLAEVRRLINSGDLVRLRRGAVALPDVDPRLRTAIALGGAVSCAQAADLLGLPLLHRQPRLHVVVPCNAARDRPRGLVVHRRDAPAVNGITTIERTVADCLRCLPEVEALVVADAAIARGVQADDVARHLLGRSAQPLRALLDEADGRSEAPGETVARHALWRAGIPATPQVQVEGVGRLDLMIDGWLVIEVDGREYHSEPKAFLRDRRRDAELTRMGFTVLRFAHTDVVDNTERLVEVVRDVMSRRS